ncbi:unnamed protein product [Camellia sinensis]
MQLLLIGDSGVGKSCLLLRFAKLLFCCLILLLSSVLFLTVTARSPIFKLMLTLQALPSIEKDNMPILKVWYLINSECLDVHSAVNSGNGLDAIKFSFCVIQKKVLEFLPERTFCVIFFFFYLDFLHSY